MFIVSLMLKLWNDKIDQIKVKNFIQNLNNKKIDIKYQMMNLNIHIKLHLIIHFQQKLFHQNLYQKDIVYLFFKYSENEEYIFDDIDIPIMKMNNIYKEVLEYVNNKTINNMCEISTISAQIIYETL